MAATIFLLSILAFVLFVDVKRRPCFSSKGSMIY